ncbi:MAG TPA: patatin-like phospholipase family protein [Thermoanaerobaculales bacterium]|nr:patatin-like phospholipase family protein [Thermoanaerobaculales bacterium]HPA80711.1 patatin-like phospholipase family protein [Thermoanaerobaculales bacterium]HQL29246.1 patatin-like phospholipase family protein [Thermoanaerobaculales bacterium]HQN96188.1 patatin-like phospholipase family protein [Thermoanaerobaculales bacterium]HQP43417.1 patatin-like phospholipase family protein [Thermoanaerobaculales bacterium]
MTLKHLPVIAAAAVLSALHPPLAASAEQPLADPDQRPKLVLVLSGGGARGVAHVGVLKVLEELHIAPDMVIGTSMGSIVGGLYAAGWTPEQIQSLVQRLDWEGAFTDAVPRSEKSFRRKQDDRPVLIQGRLAFDGLKPVLPSGVIRGQKLELILRILESLSPAASDFDHLPIPYRAVAADIATGKPVILDSGSLATAMRASMSIPGAFPPVRHGGIDLVDGGIAANLPVGIARELGATSVIAVDISSPLLAEGETLSTFAAIVGHLNSLLTAGNVSRDRALIGPDDVLITPALGDITFVSFDRVIDAAQIGEDAARAQADELRRFTASDERWQEFSSRPRARTREQLRVDSVRVANSSRVNDRIVRGALKLEPPTTLDPEPFGFSLLELYNTRYFGTLDFRLEETNGTRELVVTTPPPDRGRGSLQFGVGFLDDLDGGSGYQLSARHQLLPANRRGGEWENVLQFGTESLISTQFYQPIDSRMRWFVAPSLEFRRSVLDIYFEGQPVAEYRIDNAQAGLAAGRVLGRWGEFRATAFFADVYGEPRIGDPLFPAGDEQRGGFNLGFRVDTVDEVGFPRHGSAVDVRYTTSSSSLDSDVNFEKVWASAGHSWSFGELTLSPYLEYGENLESTLDLLDLFPLGGLFRLSGLGQRELLGERIALARLAAYWRLFGLDLAGLRVRLYTGLSLEAGNAYFDDTPMTADSLLYGGSVWVGAMTPLGPARFAYGLTEGGRDRFYLQIGDRF